MEVATAFIHLSAAIITITMKVIQEPRQIQTEIIGAAGYLTQANTSEQGNFLSSESILQGKGQQNSDKSRKHF